MFEQGLRLVEALLANGEDAEEGGRLGHPGSGGEDLAAQRLGLRELVGVGQALGFAQGGEGAEGSGAGGWAADGGSSWFGGRVRGRTDS
jgi:hypothetical protein